MRPQDVEHLATKPLDCVLAHIGEDIPVTVHYEYEPGQKEIIAPNESAQPGFPPRVVISEVLVEGMDILDDLDERCVERLEEKCWEKVRINGEANDG